MSADELEIFGEAMEIGDAEERRRFLGEACGGDAGLRRRVEGLLGVHDEMGGESRFLESGDASREQQEEQPGGGKAGPYHLLQRIGEGGWGMVYLAEQTAPVRRRVALKIIKPGTDSRQVLARFEAERQALAMMDHPNIARVLDAGATESGHPYFVMELVRGVRITQYCDQNRLTMPQRLELFILVCHAIQHAHQKGIIHRDIKPSNILVSEEDGKPVPKVIDFGIAKATEDLQLTDKTLYTQAGFFIGTPAYMSPEQALSGGADIDTRSDVYALGVLLYELLTGRTPFDGEELLRSGLETLRRTLGETDPARPSARLRKTTMEEQAHVAVLRGTEPGRLMSSLKEDLDWIVLKALEKDRTRRYDSAGALAMDVRRHLEHEPVTARPPSARDAFRKLVRRHRAVFYPAFAAAGALVVGLAISAVLFFREKAARERAVTAERKQGQLRSEADAAREVIQTRAAGSRRQLVRLNVSTGNRLAAAGGYHPALLWYVEAMRLDQDDAAAQDVHRRRYAALQRFAPSLDQLWPMEGVYDAFFVADGQRVVSFSTSGAARPWNAVTGQPLADQAPLNLEWLRGDFAGGTGPVTDNLRGLNLAVQRTPAGFEVWDRFAARNTGILLAAPGSYRTVYFSQDGKHAASVDGQKEVLHWQLPEAQARVMDGTGTDLRFVQPSLSGNGGRIAASSGLQPFDAVVWDSSTGAIVMHLKKPAGDLMDNKISPDGNLLALASWDGYARLFNVATGMAVGDAMRHERGVSSVSFSADSRWLATASWDGTARVWDTASGHPVFPSLFHAGYLPIVRFHPDGTRLLTVCQDGMVRLWKVTAGGGPVRLVLKHGANVTSARVSPDGRLAATAGRDSLIRIWNMAGGTLLTERPQQSVPMRLSFSPDNRLLGVGFEDGRVELLEAATGKVLIKTAGHASTVWTAQFSPDGTRFLTASRDGTASIWKTDTGEALFAPLRHEGEIMRAIFSPDGRLLVTGSTDKTARVWNALTGAPVTPPLKLQGPVRSVAINPANTRLLAGSYDQSQAPHNSQMWDLATAQPVGPLMPHRDGVLSAEFSPDGKYAVTSGEDGLAMIWDAVTGEALVPPLRHQSYIWKAVFSPDSRLLLTLSDDRSARVWDVLTGEPVTPPLPHEALLSDGQWLADGRGILTSSVDGTVRIWDLSPATAPLDDLQQEAEVLSSHRLRPGLGITPLTTQEIRDCWEAVRKRR